MDRREWIAYCLSFPDVYEDYPFDAPAEPTSWAVMRHKKNHKSFALIYERAGLRLNVKCDPLRADFLRSYYAGVEPGFHMNKKHWNTLTPGTDVPEEEICSLIAHSYELTRSKGTDVKKHNL